MKTIRFTIAAIIAMVASLLLMPAMASADVLDCNSTIADTTNARVLDTGQVQSAINSFTSAHPGADVYVRAFQNTPGGNTDSFWKQGLQQCSNWSDPTSSKPKPNIIMVVFGLDRKSALFYGGNYSALASSIDAIRGNDMNGNLRNGQFTIAVTASLASMSSVLSGKPVGSTSASGNSVDGGTVLAVFLWAIGALAVIAAIIGLVMMARRYNEKRLIARGEEIERQDAQTAAKKAKDDAAEQVANAKSDQELRNEFLIATGNLPAAMVAEHQKTFDRIDHSCDEQVGRFGQLSVDPDRDVAAELATDDYDELKSEYSTIALKLADAAKAYEELFAAIEQDKAALTPDARKARWTAINNDTAKLAVQLDSCSTTFDVAPTRDKLSKLLQQIDSAHEQLDNVESAVSSYDELGKLETALEKLADEVNDLVTDQAKIIAAQSSLLDTIQSHRQRLQSLTHVNGNRALSSLAQVEASLPGYIASNLSSTRSRVAQIKAIDDFVSKVNQTGRDVIAKDERIEAQKRQEREAQARREREAREEEERRRRRKRDEEAAESRRRSNSYNTTIISTSSYSSSSSSSDYGSSSSWSSGSSDFGGSSGGWGGGDSGGSSGSW